MIQYLRLYNRVIILALHLRIPILLIMRRYPKHIIAPVPRRQSPESLLRKYMLLPTGSKPVQESPHPHHLSILSHR